MYSINSIKCTITVNETISREVEVYVDDYDCEKDEDGIVVTHPKKDVNFKELYNEQHHSITKLLEILKKDCKDKLRNTQSPRKAKYLQEIIDDCEGWEDIVTEVSY